jgi:hypothetical protein
MEGIRPMNQPPHPEPSNPGHPERPGSAPLPVSPFVLVDTTTVSHAAVALARLEQWLHLGDPAAVHACAQACSNGEDDADAVASWVGTLADLLRNRIEEARSWEAGSWS